MEARTPLTRRERNISFKTPSPDELRTRAGLSEDVECEESEDIEREDEQRSADICVSANEEDGTILLGISAEGTEDL